MNYYVIALAYGRNEGDMPTKYWWGPFNMTEARDEWEKRLDIYSRVLIVKDISP